MEAGIGLFHCPTTGTLRWCLPFALSEVIGSDRRHKFYDMQVDLLDLLPYLLHPSSNPSTYFAYQYIPTKSSDRRNSICRLFWAGDREL